MHHPGTVALLWSLLGALRLDCNTRDHLVGAGAKGGTQRANETQKQVGHRAMLHDGEAAWRGTLAIEVTVGKQGSRMTTWRTTAGGSCLLAPRKRWHRPRGTTAGGSCLLAPRKRWHRPRSPRQKLLAPRKRWHRPRSPSGAPFPGTLPARPRGSTLQIGSTPYNARCSSMNDTIISVGGRAPPVRNTRRPSAGSRSPASAPAPRAQGP
jgi:hypothetical protein